MNRRQFLSTFLLGGTAVAVGGAVTAVARFMQPTLLTSEPGPVDAGLPGDYAIGTLDWIESARAYVGRDERGLYAIHAVCTHLGCTPRLDGEIFVCPCHGSRFRRDGTVLNGPAARPLARVQVGQLPNGHLYVDPGHPVQVDFRFPI